MSEEKLTKAECREILELYRTWNTGQRSNRPDENAVYDERRRLILAATKRLAELCY